MEESWKRIEEFPSYIVTTDGIVINDSTQRELRPSINQFGNAHVGLYLDGRLFRRSVAPLVADAFLEPHTNPMYNTPIHLDGDKTNCRLDNLMWRPRWFAIAYHKQFYDPYRQTWLNVPLEIVNTGERFDRAIDCCMKYGLLVREIVPAAMNEDRTVPIIWSKLRVSPR